jgi:hypothetical protein
MRLVQQRDGMVTMGVAGRYPDTTSTHMSLKHSEYADRGAT